MSQKVSAFTLIEIMISLVVFGILSILLFRTVGDMIHANARIQQEKILAQSLISIQTTINNIAEQYPYLDHNKYVESSTSMTNGYSPILYLSGDNGSATIQGTGDCNNRCTIQVQLNNEPPIYITNTGQILASNIMFKILPTQSYSTSQYIELDRSSISAPGFRLLGNIAYYVKDNKTNKSNYHLQHFVNLQDNDNYFSMP